MTVAKRSNYMLKKITILIISCLFAMTTLSGCTTETSVKNMIEEALEKRYGEEFVCHDTWYDNDGAYYTTSYYGLCSPKDSPDILFEVLIDDEGDFWRNAYVSTLASKIFCKEFDNKIGTNIGEHYTYCCNYYELDNDEVGQKIANDNFSLEYFMSDYIETRGSNKLGVYFTICVNITDETSIEYEDEYTGIINTMNYIHTIGQNYGMDLQLNIELFFVETNIYQNCISYFKDNAKINSSFTDLIEKNAPYNEPQCMIKMNYKNGEFSITEDDYIEKRKEINNV